MLNGHLQNCFRAVMKLK